MHKVITRLKRILAYGLVAAAVVLVFQGLGWERVTPWFLLGALASYYFLIRTGRCDAFMVWSDDLNTGIASFDQDHKKLMALINNVRASVLCRTGEEFERQNLQELLEYTQSHFAREEQLMLEHNYPDYEGHKAQHDQMALDVQCLAKCYETKGSKILPQLADYLTRWMVQHINGTDKKYLEFFQEKGMA
jgi:hemerythrin